MVIFHVNTLIQRFNKTNSGKHHSLDDQPKWDSTGQTLFGNLVRIKNEPVTLTGKCYKQDTDDQLDNEVSTMRMFCSDLVRKQGVRITSLRNQCCAG